MGKKHITLLVGITILLSGVFAGAYFLNHSIKRQLSQIVTTHKPVEAPKVITNYSLPTRLQIPKLKIDTHVINVGLTKDGNMSVPTNVIDAGWYKYGALPGNTGTAVLAGHLDGLRGEPGVFSNLSKLVPGDTILVSESNGFSVTFVVRETKAYAQTEQPAEVFNSTTGSHLNLITCTGSWDKSDHSFSKRLVVLFLVILGIVGGAGWYVLKANKNIDKTNAGTTKSSTTQENKQPVGIKTGTAQVTEQGTVSKPHTAPAEVADWLLYEVPSKEYKLKLADGWKLDRQSSASVGGQPINSMFTLRNDLAILSGTRATVNEIEGGRDSDTGFSISFQDKSYTSRGTKLESLYTYEGKEIVRYSFLQTQEPTGLDIPKDGKDYTYSIKGKSGYVTCYYGIAKEDVDYHENIEKVLQTVIVK